MPRVDRAPLDERGEDDVEKEDRLVPGDGGADPAVELGVGGGQLLRDLQDQAALESGGVDQ